MCNYWSLIWSNSEFHCCKSEHIYRSFDSFYSTCFKWMATHQDKHMEMSPHWLPHHKNLDPLDVKEIQKIILWIAIRPLKFWWAKNVGCKGIFWVCLKNLCSNFIENFIEMWEMHDDGCIIMHVKNQTILIIQHFIFECFNVLNASDVDSLHVSKATTIPKLKMIIAFANDYVQNNGQSSRCMKHTYYDL